MILSQGKPKVWIGVRNIYYPSLVDLDTLEVMAGPELPLSRSYFSFNYNGTVYLADQSPGPIYRLDLGIGRFVDTGLGLGESRFGGQAALVQDSVLGCCNAG